MSERKQRSPSVLQPQILCGQSVSLCTEKKTIPSCLVIIAVPRGLYVEPVVFFKSLSCVLWLNATALVLVQLFKSALLSARSDSASGSETAAEWDLLSAAPPSHGLEILLFRFFKPFYLIAMTLSLELVVCRRTHAAC